MGARLCPPVAGSASGGILEIILEGQMGRIFPAGDSAATAARIAEAIGEPARTKLMSRAGRILVEKKYSRDIMLNHLDQICRQHLNPAPG